MEDAVAQATRGQVAEEALHHVQPRGACRGKVQVDARMFGEPGFDPGVFVGGLVVHDQVQLAIRRGLRVDLFEEAQPFLMAMPGLAARCH